ncbi:MAG TPA: hypothetical protein DIT33_07560, partial [Pseudomonas sp.]|nr:hypothetical protein [Pseudomonas sp.]
MTASLGESKIQRRTLTLLGGIGALQAASCKLQAAKARGAWAGVSRSSWRFAGFIDCLLQGDAQCFFEHKNK